MTDQPPLRKPFELISVTRKGTYSVYRQILRTLGLTTGAALDKFFTEFKVKAKLDVDHVLTDPDNVLDCRELPYKNFIYGDTNVAVFDEPEYGVIVAHRAGADIEIHAVGELFLNLVDSFKLSTARAFCPKFSYPTGFKAASTINCLNSLLGLGYRVTYDGADGTTLVVLSPLPGERIAFNVERLAGLVYQMINGSLVSDLTSPEWVFTMLKKWHSEQKEVVNVPLNEA
jgi:hypothetical protein